MALPVLSSSAVKFRRVLAHFPQELSLAFAYGSGVFRQAGASAEQGEVSARARGSPGPGAAPAPRREQRSPIRRQQRRAGVRSLPGCSRQWPCVCGGSGSLSALCYRLCARLFTTAFKESYCSLSSCSAPYEGSLKYIAAVWGSFLCSEGQQLGNNVYLYFLGFC